MKITINRKQFLDLLSTAASATGKAHDLTRLVRVSVEASTLTLQATDLETGIVLDCQCEDATDGVCLVDPGPTISLMSASKAESVTIEANSRAVTLIAGNSRFELPSKDPDAFPDIKRIDGAGVEVATSALVSAINRTKFAVDADSTRYQLGGVFFEFTDEGLDLVATDGRRLSSIPVEVANPAAIGSAIVPLRGLQSIAKALPGDPEARITLDNATLQVATQRATVVCRLVEGRYPAWRSVLPAEESFKHSIPIEAGLLAAAIRQAGVTTEAESRGVELAFGPGELKITSKGQDRGKSQIELPIDTSSQVAFTIDWRFALDFAQVVPDDDVLRLFVNDGTKPIMLVWGSWKYVIMPMSRS